MSLCDITEVDSQGGFLPADFSGEIQPHTEGRGAMLFESFESAACDGFERLVVVYRTNPGEEPGPLGLWAEWVDAVAIEGSGEVRPIDGAHILQLSIVGVGWEPGAGSAHSVSGPSGDRIVEAQYDEQSGGSGGLYLGLAERTEFRVFTLDDPYRVVVDVQM